MIQSRSWVKGFNFRGGAGYQTAGLHIMVLLSVFFDLGIDRSPALIISLHE